MGTKCNRELAAVSCVFGTGTLQSQMRFLTAVSQPSRGLREPPWLIHSGYGHSMWKDQLNLINILLKKIPIIVGKAYNDLSQAYSGGLVDVYKPTGENLYHSDVNSLYPFAMLQDMPVRAPVFTTETDLDSLFGFVLAKVIAPKGLKCPVLPCRLGERLICPIGSWEGWYFTEERKLEINLGIS